MINEKFYSLPEARRRAILNAGFRVFSSASYRKSPVGEIAEEAGISKSLLFHYFHNKKALYLYLLETAAQITAEHVQASGCFEADSLFDSIERGTRAKVRMMKLYPEMAAFTLRAYYEKDEEVRREVQALIARESSYQMNAARLNLDPAQFVPGLNLRMMYQDMFLATEGYLWEKTQQGPLDADQAERDLAEMIAFWKGLYLKKEAQT